MANVLANISSIIIPAIIFYVVAYGLISRKNVYEDFIRGAADGFKTVIQIMPTLIALMVGVGILRASGFMKFLGGLLARFIPEAILPGDIVSLILVKLFSSSAATGLVLDIYKTYGTDSYAGMLTSVLMGCTETCFYTMSVYFMAAKVTKSRHTLAGALLATAAGVVMSILLAGWMTR